MVADFSYVQAGLAPELDALDLGEACEHMATHTDCLLLEGSLAAGYVNRLVKDPALPSDPRALAWLGHLLQKMAQLDPFNPALHQLTQQVAPSPETKAKAGVLAADKGAEPVLAAAARLSGRGEREAARKSLLSHLRQNPGSIRTADALLELDAQAGFPVADWLRRFTPLGLFQADWENRVFSTLYGRAGGAGLLGEALAAWERLDKNACRETQFNVAASCLLRSGASDAALPLLRRSLSLDPLQGPIARLLDELQAPFRPRPFDMADVVVCIYSFNKAELLAQTLRSLAECDLGQAACLVLLNGCSDSSLEAVRGVQGLFSQEAFRLIELPVNVGAPAARNYLIHEARKLGREFVAFLDDDVIVQQDWLPSFLTAMQDDPQLGAVGCRILDPGEEQALQYLYRDVSIAKPGMFRLSLSAPFHAPDLGLYCYRRTTDTVMGCCHLMRSSCFDAVPGFDICFTPTQLDDVAFHLDLCLKGYKVLYLGNVECIHLRATGFNSVRTVSPSSRGNALGNDVKFYYRFSERLDTLREWQTRRNAGRTPRL